MITSNAMQLKAFIKKKAEENKISAQLVMQNYMLERLLERISLSKYRDNLILKGGFLIAAIVGLDSRATMDMDTTIKGLPLTHESVHSIFDEICNIPIEDNISFSVLHTSDIRERDDYQGLRVHISAKYQPLDVTIKVDVTTGDKITPGEIEYSYKLLFDNRDIPILAYNLETILAEKLETVLSRNIANTRPRDFYDIHILYSLRREQCNMPVLKEALYNTAQKRGSLSAIENYREIISDIVENEQMSNFWTAYQEEFDYAKDINFSDTCDSVSAVMEAIS